MQKQRKTSNTTTSEIVLESLREQIINGILQPQEKLVEAEIAQQQKQEEERKRQEEEQQRKEAEKSETPEDVKDK